MIYFKNIRSIDAAHDRYRSHAMNLHPDRFSDPEEKKAAEEKFVAMKLEYEQLVAKLSAPKNEKKHVERFQRNIQKRMRKIQLDPVHAKRITHHASKLAGAVAESIVVKISGKIFDTEQN